MTPITLQLIKKPAIYGMILLFSGLPLVSGCGTDTVIVGVNLTIDIKYSMALQILQPDIEVNI